MRIVLFGGSGFLGRHLLSKLSASDHAITLITRRPHEVKRITSPTVEVKTWSDPAGLAPIVDGTDAVVNLSGESIGAMRWSANRKQEILSSRIETTRTIVEAIGRTSKMPSTLLNASAVGYYGNVENGEVTETQAPGNDFLAALCVGWEDEARKAERLGVRVILPRTGIVLADDGGALQRMILPFRLFAGGPLGSGNQWFPWIHIEDEIGAMIHLLEQSAVSGPINLVAPEPITMRQFCSAIGRAIHRPSRVPVPSFMLKMVLGEMAGALVLGGQKAVSWKLLDSGYRFKYSRIDEALSQIFT